MSDNIDQPQIDAKRAQIANEFDQDLDPLAGYSERFESLSIDPFELYLDDVLSSQGLSDSTFSDYRRNFNQFRNHMGSTDRHPACPTESHIKGFALKYRDEIGNRPDTVKKKLRRLNKAYEYWQDDPSFPHPKEYNPFHLAMKKLNLSKPSVKEPHNISLETLRSIIQTINHIRDRIIVIMQTKLGLRAGEICNLQIQDISINNAELKQFYPELGTHWMLDGCQNAVYIPPEPNDDLPAEGRRGNKSRRPRVLPLDDELRQALIRYLLTRPDTGDPWVFLSKRNHQKLENEGVNNIWLDTFHPEYEETDRYRGVTSHFGRHFFSTYWRIEEDLNRDLLKYMRGDVVDNGSIEEKDILDEYVHTFFGDIETPYRQRIFRLSS